MRCWGLRWGVFLLAHMLPTQGNAQEFQVTFLHTPPAQAYKGKPVVVSGTILGADQVDFAVIVFKSSDSYEYEPRRMELVSGDLYQGIIPGEFVRPPAVEYYCYAVDFEGNRRIIFASQRKPQRVLVHSSVEPTPKKADKIIRDKSAEPRPVTVASYDKLDDTTQRITQLVQTDSKVKFPEGKTPITTSVVSREEIRAIGALTLEGILSHVPGTYVSRMVSGEYRPAIHGILTSPGILLLLDGLMRSSLFTIS